eukprot:scaffold264573_cov46-Attheya_sp.AAC.1
MMSDTGGGGLCGSQQSTRSLTTDGAAFVIYVSCERQKRGLAHNHIPNLRDVSKISPDVVSGSVYSTLPPTYYTGGLRRISV